MIINHELITVEAVQGKTDKQLRPHNSSQLDKNVTYAYDGYLLKELKITFNIKTASDINYLIADLEELKIMLEIHKYCFLIGGVDVNLLK